MKWIAVALAVEAAALAALLAVSLDIWTHKRVEQWGGVNIWGYRGTVLPLKHQNEIRIAFVGGDLAWGWGEAAGGTLPPAVRQLVMLETDRPGQPLHPVTAVNLGVMGLTPGEYAAWIEHFAYLGPDVVCIVADPRNHRSHRTSLLPDRQSTAFVLFGYAPILPLVLEEKGVVVHSRVLTAIGSAAVTADHAIARIVRRGRESADRSRESTAAYVGALEATVRTTLKNSASVVLVAPPHDDPDDTADHNALAAMMSARFADDRRVRFVDLGDAADIYDEALRLNGFDFSSAGIARAAQILAPSVTELVRAAIH